MGWLARDLHHGSHAQRRPMLWGEPCAPGGTPPNKNHDIVRTNHPNKNRKERPSYSWLHQLLIPSTPSTAPPHQTAACQSHEAPLQRPAPGAAFGPVPVGAQAQLPQGPRGRPGSRVSASGGRENGGETNPPGFDTFHKPETRPKRGEGPCMRGTLQGTWLPEKNIAPGTSASTSFCCT